jgi:opacity protein-like surface antigen
MNVHAMWKLLPACVVGVAVMFPHSAEAVPRGAGAVSFEAGYTRVAIFDDGFGFGGAGYYGLNDVWAITLNVLGSFHHTNDPERVSGVTGQGGVFAGTSFSPSYAHVAPVLELTLGVHWSEDAALSSQSAGLGYQASAGAEYRLTRSWALGVIGRWSHSLIPMTEAAANQSRWALMLLARVSWTFSFGKETVERP